MKKIRLLLAQHVAALALLIFGFVGKLSSQTITISGAAVVQPASQETYQASFSYSVNPYTNLSWSVDGGTIISSSINPTLTVWCTIEWDNDAGMGTISLSDDMQNISGSKVTDRGTPQLLWDQITFYDQYESPFVAFFRSSYRSQQLSMV
jgi:hypothetical protein